MKPDVMGTYRQLASIEKHAIEVRTSGSKWGGEFDELSSILQEYEDARSHFLLISSREGLNVFLRPLAQPKDTDGSRKYGSRKYISLLREIEIECEKDLEPLSSIIVPLSKDEMDKLQSLRDEFKKLSTELKNPYYEPNVLQAIDEYEKGHMLALVLISSRVIIYALQQIPGDNDEQRTNFLREKGVIGKKREDTRQFVLKASHKSRGFFSHELRLSPSPSDALSLLGDTLKILEIISQLDAVHDQKGE